jgi:hypothetical protein
MTPWLADKGSRTSNKTLLHDSRGRRTLDAATATPLNLCRVTRQPIIPDSLRHA